MIRHYHTLPFFRTLGTVAAHSMSGEPGDGPDAGGDDEGDESGEDEGDDGGDESSDD